MKQVVVTKASGEPVLTIADRPEPVPSSSEALVEVQYVSLNRGEVTAAFKRAADGWAPGWDFSGVVVQAAQDGSGPPVGSRVVAFKESGAWAQRVTVPGRDLAVVPDAIGLDVAATLPVAGLTALYALEKRGNLVGKEILITGASGGMGQFAVQLALLAGANVTATVYRNTLPYRSERLRVLKSDADGLREMQQTKYDLIIESIGGEMFAAAARSLAFGGTLVTLGATQSTEAAFDIRQFFNTGRASIYGFMIFDEVADKPQALGLERLLRLIETGALSIPIARTAPLDAIDTIARDLLESKVPGKAVIAFA